MNLKRKVKRWLAKKLRPYQEGYVDGVNDSILSASTAPERAVRHYNVWLEERDFLADCPENVVDQYILEQENK